MKRTHPLIPMGGWCGRLETMAPGEVLSKDLHRYGQDTARLERLGSL
jgi:hypothetical protein